MKPRRQLFTPSDVYLFSFHRASNRDVLSRHMSDKGSFTDALFMPDVAADLELALISFDGEQFTAAGLFTSGSRAATGKRRGKFDFIRKFPEAVPVKQSLAKISTREDAIDATGRILPTTNLDFFARALDRWIEENYPSSHEIINQILRTRQMMLDRRSDPQHLVLADQRDSVGLALDIAGLDRPGILRNAKEIGKTPLRSYLDILPESTVKVDEAFILEQDMQVFGDWRQADPQFKGTRVYSNGRSTVTLMCVDRSHIEAVTGVDLIYHIDTYDSFIMVQYKRIANGTYRPDRRCYDQMHRMHETFCRMQASVPLLEGSEQDFRLSTNPFYIKICEDEMPVEVSESLSEGMYFPLQHWRCLLGSSSSRGPREGISINRNTAPRWLSNTEFVDIAKKGWIGSTRIAGQRWVRELIPQALGDARSLILGRLMHVDVAELYRRADSSPAQSLDVSAKPKRKRR